MDRANCKKMLVCCLPTKRIWNGSVGRLFVLDWAMHLNIIWIIYECVDPRCENLPRYLLALVCGVFCEFVTFPLVSWVRCGTWLYRFLIFATLLLWLSELFCLCCVAALKSLPALSFNALIFPILRIVCTISFHYSLSLLYLLVISWFICFRRWCIDKLGVFHANQIFMCLDPHLN